MMKDGIYCSLLSLAIFPMITVLQASKHLLKSISMAKLYIIATHYEVSFSSQTFESPLLGLLSNNTFKSF